MKFSIDLEQKSSSKWLECVMNDFDTFLQDHADCERKASAMAMSFVAKYPNRKEIIPELIDTAVEEMEHFRDVYKIMEKRNLSLNHEIKKDVYVKQLLNKCRSGRDDRFMDRLLLASIIECRGAERFQLIADGLEEGELKEFYKRLWRSEAKHGNIFVKMALNYFKEDAVYTRLKELNKMEGEVLNSLPINPALH